MCKYTDRKSPEDNLDTFLLDTKSTIFLHAPIEDFNNIMDSAVYVLLCIVLRIYVITGFINQ